MVFKRRFRKRKLAGHSGRKMRRTFKKRRFFRKKTGFRSYVKEQMFTLKGNYTNIYTQNAFNILAANSYNAYITYNGTSIMTAIFNADARALDLRTRFDFVALGKCYVKHNYLPNAGVNTNANLWAWQCFNPRFATGSPITENAIQAYQGARRYNQGQTTNMPYDIKRWCKTDIIPWFQETEQAITTYYAPTIPSQTLPAIHTVVTYQTQTGSATTDAVFEETVYWKLIFRRVKIIT